MNEAEFRGDVAKGARLTTLGTLKRLDPRTIWPNEAHDFTPWLAEHLEDLGEALGLELELVARESPVGRFSADLLARDLGTGRMAVIENQLEPTDHSHLGQLITYAAGLEATIVIWVCREMREEHRQALDWLNRGHGAATDFFGVIVELIQIDESAPAASFRPVAFPNDWSRRTAGTARGTTDLSTKQQLYQQFFQQLIDGLREQHHFTNARAGQLQNWYSFSSRVRGFTYGASFASGGRLRTELYIDLGDLEANQRAFETLLVQKSQIETAFGEQLEWEALDGKRACRIASYRDGSIEDSAESLEEYRNWATDRLLRFKRAFAPKLANLV